MKLQSTSTRVKNFLKRTLKAPWARFSEVPDPRDPRGVRWPWLTLLRVLLSAMLRGDTTLREIERHSEQFRFLGIPLLRRRLPDTTLYDGLKNLSFEGLRKTLVKQVRSFWRSKQLLPVGLPFGVVAVDGKVVGTLNHDAKGYGQAHHRAHDGTPYFWVRVLRAELTSSSSRCALE